MSVLRVALVQQSCGPDPEENLGRSEDFVRKAAAGGARLVVLPELHRTRYFCQTEDPANFDLAEPIAGPTTQRLARLAAENAVVLVASVFERRAAGLYHNTAVVFDRDGRLAGTYRKMHLPDDPQYYEKFYFAPGDTGFVPISTSAGKLGVLVCWDQWYPEAARLMALRGADMLIYPTAIGAIPSEPADEQARQRDAWITIQRGHAIANGMPLVAVNRVGFEPAGAGDAGIAFWGSSFAVGPQGESLAQALPDGEYLLFADLDMARAEEVRRMWPFLRDRRIDAYGALSKRFDDDAGKIVTRDGKIEAD